MSDGILRQIVKDEAWEKFASPQYMSISDPFSEPIKTYYKISICTTCMGRLADIKQTYIQNIKDNEGYPKIEFVLLDYNSRDGLGDWVKSNLMEYIDRGIVNYYRTTEPEYYSMTHSRNIAFKVATGDIVNNVDADHFTNKDFAAYVNMIANRRSSQVAFVKSTQKNRGRLGFFKNEFRDVLGGYNEDIMGYGYDDADLLHRATMFGFIAVKFGGEFMRITDDHERHPTGNYENTNWKYTQRRNTLISLLSIAGGYHKANRGRHWGKAKLMKNFVEEISI